MQTLHRLSYIRNLIKENSLIRNLAQQSKIGGFNFNFIIK